MVSGEPDPEPEPAPGRGGVLGFGLLGGGLARIAEQGARTVGQKFEELEDLKLRIARLEAQVAVLNRIVVRLVEKRPRTSRSKTSVQAEPPAGPSAAPPTNAEATSPGSVAPASTTGTSPAADSVLVAEQLAVEARDRRDSQLKRGPERPVRAILPYREKAEEHPGAHRPRSRDRAAGIVGSSGRLVQEAKLVKDRDSGVRIDRSVYAAGRSS